MSDRLKNRRVGPQGLPLAKTLPFACLGSACQNSCCGPFHGTTAVRAVLEHADLGDDIQRPGREGLAPEASIFAQIRLTEHDVRRLQDAALDGAIVRRGDPSSPSYYLKLKPDGTCESLSPDGMCSIHHSRPTLCRAFPFYIDMFVGLSMVEACPGVGAGESSVADLQEEIEAAVEMTSFWIREIINDG